jgi:hypothetical protein
MLAYLGLLVLQQIQKEHCLSFWLFALACRCIMQWIKSMGRQVCCCQPACAEVASAAGAIQPGDAPASAEFLAACLRSLPLTTIA